MDKGERGAPVPHGATKPRRSLYKCCMRSNSIVHRFRLPPSTRDTTTSATNSYDENWRHIFLVIARAPRSVNFWYSAPQKNSYLLTYLIEARSILWCGFIQYVTKRIAQRLEPHPESDWEFISSRPLLCNGHHFAAWGPLCGHEGGGESGK